MRSPKGEYIIADVTMTPDKRDINFQIFKQYQRQKQKNFCKEN